MMWFDYNDGKPFQIEDPTEASGDKPWHDAIQEKLGLVSMTSFGSGWYLEVEVFNAEKPFICGPTRAFRTCMWVLSDVNEAITCILFNDLLQLWEYHARVGVPMLQQQAIEEIRGLADRFSEVLIDADTGPTWARRFLHAEARERAANREFARQEKLKREAAAPEAATPEAAQ